MNEIYKRFENPPEDALKEIGAGRLKGMTDINPQWRIECLTELFGLCGQGWYTKITEQKIIDGADGEKVAITNIELYYKQDGEWSMPIQATGGSKLVSNEKAGAYTSDEAFKMAYTDALSVACKMIGIAGKIYRGQYNTKYQADRSEPKRMDFDSLETKEDFVKAIHSCVSVKQLNALYWKWKDKDFAKELQKESAAKKLALENPDLIVKNVEVHDNGDLINDEIPW
jgi:hypothetical protein